MEHPQVKAGTISYNFKAGQAGAGPHPVLCAGRMRTPPPPPIPVSLNVAESRLVTTYLFADPGSLRPAEPLGISSDAHIFNPSLILLAPLSAPL